MALKLSQREIRKYAREADRARQRAIKTKLREMRRARPQRLREIREACRVARLNVRSRVIALREETRAALRESVLAMRQAQRGDCELTKAATKDDFARRIGAAGAELGAEREHYRTKFGRRGATRTTAKERREESDDDVRRNLPPELVAVFNRIGRSVKASPRRSRTEAFLQWVHDNEDEAHAIVYEAIDRDVDRLVREQEAIARRLRQKHRGESALDALAADIPF